MAKFSFQNRAPRTQTQASADLPESTHSAEEPLQRTAPKLASRLDAIKNKQQMSTKTGQGGRVVLANIKASLGAKRENQSPSNLNPTTQGAPQSSRVGTVERRDAPADSAKVASPRGVPPPSKPRAGLASDGFFSKIKKSQQLTQRERAASPKLVPSQGAGQQARFNSAQKPAHTSGAIPAPRRFTAQTGGTYAGIPSSACEGFSDSIPPGSHYEQWVWDAMDRPGHITLEVYADANASIQTSSADQCDDPAKRLDKPDKAGPKRVAFDPERHTLVSVPEKEMGKNFLWWFVRRAILVPVGTKAVKLHNWSSSEQGYSQDRDSQQDRWIAESDPASVTQFLRPAPHKEISKNVIFGEILISEEGNPNPSAYWLVVPFNAARSLHQYLYGQDGKGGADTQHRFGRATPPPKKKQQTEDGYWVNVEADPRTLSPVHPSKRFLGYWEEPTAQEVIHRAHRGDGPVFPEECEMSAEEVRIIRSLHWGIANREHRTRPDHSTQESENPGAPAQARVDEGIIAPMPVGAIHEDSCSFDDEVIEFEPNFAPRQRPAIRC